MKAFLMYRDRDFDLGQTLAPNEQDLTQDLGLAKVFEVMAGGDKFLLEVARKTVLSSLTNPEAITYRQHVLDDCMKHPTIAREIYEVAVAAIESERKVWRSVVTRFPTSVLHESVEVMELFVRHLKTLRSLAAEHADKFRSDGFVALFERLKSELDEEYFGRVEGHLRHLQFRDGVLISARLGKGHKGIDYVLRRPRGGRPRWWQWICFLERSPYTIVIAERDDNGFKALAELRSRGINLAANALAQSADHILRFFTMLRAELGFYVGCLNLWDRLAAKGETVCFPMPMGAGRPILSGRGLYDVSLSLSLNERVVGNDVSADGKRLVMITGANQGGKSTFLRSLGLAHLMMQAGMFVGAEAFRASVCEGLYTHYKREEDPTMRSGKLDEELARMSQIADRVTRRGIILFNESFAATNEREGAEIASSIVRALLEADIKVGFVTHSFELAHRFHSQASQDALFLRAERQADGRRTFKLVAREPLPTSYGEDLYRRIFESAADRVP